MYAVIIEILIFVVAMIAVVIDLFDLRAPRKKKFVITTFRCHYQEEVEFSGGYRDAAHQTKKCDYKLQCSGKGKFELFCPEHGTKLK